VKLEKDVNNFS